MLTDLLTIILSLLTQTRIMKKVTGKKLIYTIIWAMQCILLTGAIVAFVEFGSNGLFIDLFSGCFMIFACFWAYKLRRDFNIQLAKNVRDAANRDWLAKNVRDAANRDWLAKQDRRTRRAYGAKGKKPVSPIQSR
jgi:high-affinity Fe2+/Pb2+ permease